MSFGAANSVLVPDTINGVPVTEIAAGAAEGNAALRRVVLGANVRTIGQNAFYGAIALENIFGLEQLAAIDVGAFRGTPRLNRVITLSNRLTRLGARAFQDSGVTGVVFADRHTGAGVEEPYALPAFAFADTFALRYVVLPIAGLLRIEASAFAGSALREVYVGEAGRSTDDLHYGEGIDILRRHTSPNYTDYRGRWSAPLSTLPTGNEALRSAAVYYHAYPQEIPIGINDSDTNAEERHYIEAMGQGFSGRGMTESDVTVRKASDAPEFIAGDELPSHPIAAPPSSTVTWLTQDGKAALKTDENVVYGDKPSFDGETPSIASTAEYDYAFAGWAARAGKSKGTLAANLSAVSGDTTYYAAFRAAKRSYAVTTAGGVANGAVAVDKETCLWGDTVTLTVTPDAGYVLSALTVKGASAAPVAVTGGRFTMPDEAVEVSATFKKTVDALTVKDKGGYAGLASNGYWLVTMDAYGLDNTRYLLGGAEMYRKGDKYYAIVKSTDATAESLAQTLAVDTTTAGSRELSTDGNLNQSGGVTAADSSIINALIWGSETGYEVSDWMRLSADMNGDGKVTTADIIWVLEAAVGKPHGEG